jgi:hypothetical protein
MVETKERELPAPSVSQEAQVSRQRRTAPADFTPV